MIRNRADWRPVLVTCGGVALAVWPFLHTLSWSALGGVTFAALVLRSISPLHQHHHAHHPIFRAAWANHLYDFLLLAAAGNTTAVWELQHVRGHHRTHLDAKNDANGLKRVQPFCEPVQLEVTIHSKRRDGDPLRRQVRQQTAWNELLPHSVFDDVVAILSALDAQNHTIPALVRGEGMPVLPRAAQSVASERSVMR